MDTNLIMTKSIDVLIMEFEDEIKNIKRYGLICRIILPIYLFPVIIKFFLKDIIVVMILLTFIVFFTTLSLKKGKQRVKEIKISLDMIKKDKKMIIKEMEDGIYNKEKEYLITTNYYFDLHRKTAIKFNECKDLKLKFNFCYIPFMDEYGFSNLIVIKTIKDEEIRILNWTFKRVYYEGDEIYKLLTEKIKPQHKKNNE